MKRALLKRNLLLLYSLAGFGMLGRALYRPIVPIFARRVGASGFEVGLLSSGFMLARAVTSFVIGRSTDKVQHGKVFVQIGFFFMLLTTLGYIYAETYPGILVLRFIQGVCSGMVWPVTQIMVVENAGAGIRARALSLYQITGRVGALLSRVCLSILLLIAVNMRMGEIESFRVVFFVGSIFLLLGFVDGLFIRDRHPVSRPPAKSRSRYSIFILGFFFGAMLALAPLSYVFFNEYFTLEPFQIAILLLCLDVITMIAMYAYSHISDNIGMKYSLLLTLAPCIIAALILPFSSHIVVFIGLYFVIRLSLSSFLPISRAYATSFSTGVGANIGTLNMMSNLGSVVGPIVAGFIYDHFTGGMKIAGYSFFAVLLIPVGMYVLRPYFAERQDQNT